MYLISSMKLSYFLESQTFISASYKKVLAQVSSKALRRVKIQDNARQNSPRPDAPPPPKAFNRQTFQIVFLFFRLTWETSTNENLAPEASDRPETRLELLTIISSIRFFVPLSHLESN